MYLSMLAFIYKNIAGTGLLISTSQSSTLTLLDFDSFDTILETKKDLDIISKKYSEIFPKEEKKLNDEAHRTEITDELKTTRAIKDRKIELVDICFPPGSSQDIEFILFKYGTVHI